MKQALLFWDKIHVIAPWRDFRPRHQGEIAEAWKMVGAVTVPDDDEKQIAHEDIMTLIENRERLPRALFLNEGRGGAEVYDMYDRKLLGETWRELRREGFAGELMEDGDRQLTTWGGLVVMAKLADACAGDIFARVTDRTAAYRAIADEIEPAARHARDAAATVPILLSLIDANSIPLENLMHFRDGEKSPALRHQLLDVVNDHIQELKKARSVNQINELQVQFEGRMERNLEELRDTLRWNKIKFVTSASVLGLATGAFVAAAHFYNAPLTIGSALAAGGAAGLGVKQLTDLFGAGVDLSDKQRTTLAKYPMAYMHMLSEDRMRLARPDARGRRD